MTARQPRILECALYRGPHLYSAIPMARIQIDLGWLEDWPTDRIDGFTPNLLRMLPGLQRHGCCYGEPGGFVRRLVAGTWFGHVVEHVALELQTGAGAPVSRGKTRSVRGRPGVYDILYSYREEEAALLAGRLALQLCDGLLPPSLRGVEELERVSPDRDGGLASIRSTQEAVEILAAVVRRRALGPSTRALVDVARRRGIPVERLNGQSLIRLGWGARQRLLRASVTDRTGLIAADLAGDKAQAKAMLAAIGCPIAEGEVVRTSSEALRAARRLGEPLVVKPLDANHGRGVSTGLSGPDEVAQAFERAAVHSRRVIVERQLAGRDHRVLVVGGEVVAAAERRPPCVVGDGRRSVAELVEALNQDPRRGEGHEKVMTRVRLADEAVLASLQRQGLSPQDQPAAGQEVVLDGAANLSRGGVAIDRTDQIHPENAAIARRAALALGLDVAGVDLLAPDIGRSIRETGGGVIEVNAAPGLRMHLAPSEGSPRDVAGPIIDLMFPRRASARIPVAAITGTNGKSTVGRMVAHILMSQGVNVGLTNTNGVYIGRERVWKGDASGPRSARMVLRDPTVEAAVMECARGGVLREGLAFDRCDVGCVLNVQPDHLGLNGIETLEDLARVKSVIVENVSRRGISVLNADDPLTIRMARHARGRVCWFSMRGGKNAPAFILQHVAQGGAAVLHDAATGRIKLYDGDEIADVCRAEDIPATWSGKAAFNIANALAAVAICHGMGVSGETAGAALRSFSSSFEQNPGRLNVHDGHGFRVILDYAHNPEGLRALGRLVLALRPSLGRVIAMISIPGDRRDEEIRAMGEIGAEYFDHLVFRETPDNRGRAAGEVNRLLREGAMLEGCDVGRIEDFLTEEEAVEYCLRAARPGDLVVLTPTRIEEVWDRIEAFRPTPVPEVAAPFLLEPAHG